MGWGYFPKSKPREAKGGIKWQGKRAASWWAKRWMETLEDYGLGARLSRGRSYARNGQVLSVDVVKGKVTGKVQGSRPKPYEVTISVDPLSSGEWERVVDALRGQAVFAAKLLAGEMPEDVEQVFSSLGISLFPAHSGDLKTDCTCPDWSNPCKHSAAVYILLGEEFDRDPFLLFKLRGMERDELLRELAESANAAETAGDRPRWEPEALPADPARYWSMGAMPESGVEARMPPVHAGPLKRLGGFPFWRGEKPLADALEPVYREASVRGLAAYAGEESGRNQE